jgi:hypothetical protein
MESSRKEDYETINDFLVEACGKDLLTLGPDLQATGLISGWNPKTFRIRRSELGTLLAKQE